METINYFNESDKEVLNQLTEIAEDLGFGVGIQTSERETLYYVTFSKFTNRGQDFSFTINVDSEDSLSDIQVKISDYYDSYDVSYEAYLWLDENGHGKNGAPWDMKDVYENMQQCESYIESLSDKVLDFCIELMGDKILDVF